MTDMGCRPTKPSAKNDDEEDTEDFPVKAPSRKSEKKKPAHKADADEE